MKQILLFTMVVFLLLACNDTEREEPAKENTEQHQASRKSPDIEGTYSGTIPCAACDGINMVVTLNANHTFTLREEYKGTKDQRTFKTKGSYTLQGDIASLEFTGEDANRVLRFRIEEEKLFVLDTEEKMVEGDEAKAYILSKR